MVCISFSEEFNGKNMFTSIFLKNSISSNTFKIIPKNKKPLTTIKKVFKKIHEQIIECNFVHVFNFFEKR